ncbi:endolytic transglycosylase MltG [Actinocrispum wychmicini]|uniref:Endolytic murein transglycosylase n=1 Tax=Actinocrispum wychmicini TaxID=1213861 RepID=A0A4R2IXZ3_9PSEU|nr:endolytic transglycosylase MltG [Actinocrispum wychmicini]TCO49862.1 UPF0755 protein [Actinocrispum wychmicini]
MTDGLGLFDNSRGDLDNEDDYDDEQPGERQPRRRRRGPLFWVIVAVVVALIGGGAYYGVTEVLGFGSYDDYPGTGESDVIVEVKAGQSVGDIGSTLKDKGIVASPRAFTVAGEDDSKVKAIQPGFYELKTKMSGKAAVARITDKDARKGQLQIKPGAQLDDVTQPNKSVTAGIWSLIARAGTVTMNGKQVGPTVEELRKVAETADLAKLGVPAWAVQDAAKAEPKRRLEGLIAAGVYDVMPGQSAEDLLKTVLSDSASQLDGFGMPKLAADTGFTPYQVLIIGSLIEREGIKNDFGKISRVVYTRLAEKIPLGFDSTVNYVLDRPVLTTNEGDRNSAGPYNTYKLTGLTPTPISAPSRDALGSAAKPEAGDFRFFVKCKKDGTSCFAATKAEHDANVAKAHADGVF